MPDPAERPSLNCAHDHEWVDLEKDGSTYGVKWNDYKIRIEAIVVKKYRSEEERLLDSQPVYGGPLWLDPNNPLQYVKPIRWRIYRKGSRAYVELAHSGTASIQMADQIRTPLEAGRVWEGLILIKRVVARHGKQTAFKDGEDLERAIINAFVRASTEKAKSGGQVRYTQELIAERLDYSAKYIYQVLFPRFGLDSSKVARKAKKAAATAVTHLK